MLRLQNQHGLHLMTYKQALKYFKKRCNLAAACGVTTQAVQRWKETGKIPLLRQYQIQEATDGELKAGK